MNQIQFETNWLTVLCVNIPIESRNVHIWGYRLMCYETKEKFKDVILPEGDWQIHAGTDAEITDEQLEVLLPTTHKHRRFSHLMEILRSHGIDPNEKYVLLIKEK